ncbi:MAG TPA: HAD family hydrolase [Marinilabiliaceae bacterium]|nr:HAD family hydrolase [Marinilabiliaceae bacterium]
MNIRLVISDLDGTLLNDDKEINPEFWGVYEALKERGIMFSVASGRQLYTMEQQFERIKGEIFFIAENGAIIKKGDEVVHQDALGREEANELVRLAREIPDANPILCGVKSAYIESTQEPFFTLASKFYRSLSVVNDLTKVDDIVLKLAIADSQDPAGNSYKYFKKYDSKYKITISGPDWIDIASFTANKGSAIALIKKKLDIKNEEIMVFGDFPNDFEMMQMGLHSYAMKNAHPEILNIARYITEKDNNENGVVETIKKVLLQDVHQQQLV